MEQEFSDSREEIEDFKVVITLKDSTLHALNLSDLGFPKVVAEAHENQQAEHGEVEVLHH